MKKVLNVKGLSAPRGKTPFNSILFKIAGGIMNERRPKVEKKDGRHSGLTPDQVREIRAAWNGRADVAKRLAEKYGISVTYAARVGSGETHKYVI